MEKKLEEQFNTIIGEVPDRAIMKQYGKEFCVMCGHPTKNDKTVKEIKQWINSNFISVEEVEGMKKEINHLHYGCTQEFEEGLARINGYNEALDNVRQRIKERNNA